MKIPGYDAWKLASPEDECGDTLCPFCGAYSRRNSFQMEGITPMTDKTLEACPTALEALKWNQRQLDMDGVEVGVSRQALDELIAAYDVLQSAPGVVDIAKASESIAEMVADWYGNAPLPNARITASVIAARLSRFPISSSTTSAGVTEEQVEAACAAFTSDWPTLEEFEKEHYRKNMRAALQASQRDAVQP